MLVGETEHWRLMFLFGWIGIVSLVLMRRNVPESPRWLILKNRKREADSIISAIEEAIK
jgi:putative MFS transporter